MHIKNNFDGVRLAAALAVLTSHQFWIAGHPEPLTFGPMTLGGLAVLVFFSISGYLVASSWVADPKPWRFAARRLLRIWPAYAVVVVCTSLWIGMTDSRPLADTAAWMFVSKHLFFHSFEWDFFPALRDARLNPSIWTIPFELACYLAFALVAIVLRKWWAAFLVAVCGPAFIWWGFGMASFDPSAATLVMDGILFGAFFAFGAALFGVPVLRTAKGAALLVLSGVIAFKAGSEVIGLALTIPTLAIFAGERTWPVLSRAGQFGDFSYGVYLWGWPVQQVIAVHLGPGFGVWRLLAVSTIVVTLLAALSWHLVEKRALRAKPTRNTAWPRALTLERT
jgi:peptidoglycan/LPS O-acetylase OafA/YrhL